MRQALVVGLSCLLVAAGCRARTAAITRHVPPPKPPETGAFRAVVAVHNDLGLNLLGELREAEPTGNCVISPVSVGLALHMIYNGAGGETLKAMQKALSLGSVSLQDLNQGNADLLRVVVPEGSGTELSLADSVWIRRGFTFAEPFLTVCHDAYQAEAQVLDLRSPQGPKTIDAWVKRQTRGRIDRIVPVPLPDNTTLILVNAAYLNAPWQDPFERHLTREDEFTLPDGTRKKIMLMHQEGHWLHASGEGFQVVALPYRDGLTCYGFLPDRDSSLDRMLSGLTRAKLDLTVDQMTEATVSLSLPRFRVEWGGQLNDAFSALGMEVAFDPARAQFPKLTPAADQLWIDSVMHKTYLQVDEQGTEAAAATEVVVAMKAAMQPSPLVEMRFDRPFLLIIRHDATQVILFLAAVTDPQAA